MINVLLLSLVKVDTRDFIDLGLSIILLVLFCLFVSKAVKKTVFIMIALLVWFVSTKRK